MNMRSIWMRTLLLAMLASSFVYAQDDGDDLKKEVIRLRMKYKQDMKRYEERTRQLTADIQAMAEVVNKQTDIINELNKRVTEVSEHDRKIVGMLKKVVDDLNAEAKERHAADKKIIETVKVELTHITKISSARRDVTPEGRPLTTYTVQAGDTLGAIAIAFGTTTTFLKKINKMDNDTIVIGRKLNVPEL
jgi:LysM repeat protein